MKKSAAFALRVCSFGYFDGRDKPLVGKTSDANVDPSRFLRTTRAKTKLGC